MVTSRYLIMQFMCCIKHCLIANANHCHQSSRRMNTHFVGLVVARHKERGRRQRAYIIYSGLALWVDTLFELNAIIQCLRFSIFALTVCDCWQLFVFHSHYLYVWYTSMYLSLSSASSTLVAPFAMWNKWCNFLGYLTNAALSEVNFSS